MVSSGMRDAGYEYVNIDDCWLTNTRSNGQPQFTQQFANGGIAAIAEYVHERGLKLGIYSAHGRPIVMMAVTSAAVAFWLPCAFGCSPSVKSAATSHPVVSM